MRAAVCTRYGPPEVLQLGDVDRPVPLAHDVLVRVGASTVNSSDCFVRSGIPQAAWPMRLMLRVAVGFGRPRRSILGMVAAGAIEERGGAAARFRLGERVIAFTGLRFGAWAESARVRDNGLVERAPANLGDEGAAALVYGGLLALWVLRRAEIQQRRRVLIYGASGAAGVAAVQLAKHFGADVTAVCGGANLDAVRTLGADTVLDYATEHGVGERRFDLVLDAVGRRKTSPLKEACKIAVAPGGVVASVDDGRPRFVASDLALLTELAEAGRLVPVIDRLYPLERIAEAHRYVETGHKRGSVVVRIATEP